MKKLLVALIAGTWLAAFVPQAHATIINLDYTVSLNHAIALDAGTYHISAFGTGDGPEFLYDAYNVWGFERCRSDTDCTNGWRWRYTLVADPNADHADVSNLIASFSTDLFSTALGALEAAKALDPFEFTLDSAQTLFFVYRDSNYSDNLGGVSLELIRVQGPGTAVPEPSVLALLGAGLVGFGLRRHRHRD